MGVCNKLNDTEYISKNKDIRIKQELQHKAFKKDEEKVKNFFRQLKTKFRKENRMLKNGQATYSDLQEIAANEDEEDNVVEEHVSRTAGGKNSAQKSNNGLHFDTIKKHESADPKTTTHVERRGRPRKEDK
jgi:hypothetical protein